MEIYHHSDAQNCRYLLSLQPMHVKSNTRHKECPHNIVLCDEVPVSHCTWETQRFQTQKDIEGLRLL